MKLILDDNTEKHRKDLLNKLGEISLYKKNLEHNYEILRLPKLFTEGLPDIEGEIKKRKEFDVFFQKVMYFLQHKFIIKEEERRKQ